MNENSHRLWDILFKFIAVIGGIVSFYYGIAQFEKTSQRDFAKDFYHEEILFYNNLVAITSTIANSSINDSLKKDHIQKFELIYIGQKEYFVQDEILLDEIRKFNDAVVHLKAKKYSISEDEQTYERAEKYAILIGKSARRNINKIINDTKLMK